jgi:hypothetical protein
MRILATKCARGRKNFPAKKLSIYIFGGKIFSYLPPLALLPYPPLTLLATTPLDFPSEL